MISILIVVNDGFPPLVVALPMAKKIRHITAKVAKYVETYKIPFLALFSPALSTVITVITDRGLTIDAMAKGTTVMRSCDNVFSISPHSINSLKRLHVIRMLLLKR